MTTRTMHNFAAWIWQKKLVLFAAGSFLLFTACAIVHVRSHFYHDDLFYIPKPPIPNTHGQFAWWLESDVGSLRLGRNGNVSEEWLYRDDLVLILPGYHRKTTWSDADYKSHYTMDFRNRRASGFDFAINPEWGYERTLGDITFTMAAPYWFLELLFIAVPFQWSLPYLRMRLRKSQIISLFHSLGFPLIIVALLWFTLRPELPESRYARDTDHYYAPPTWLWWTLFAITIAALLATIALKRNRRLDCLAGASLVFLVTIASLWIRSHLVFDQLACVRPQSSSNAGDGILRYLQSNSGGVQFVVMNWNGHGIFADAAITPPRGFPTGLHRRTSKSTPDYPHRPQGYNAPLTFPNSWGFDFFRHENASNADDDQYPNLIVAAPYWFLCLLPLPFPALWLRRHFHRSQMASRQAAGRCPKCNYDVRATPARCPECGTELSSFRFSS